MSPRSCCCPLYEWQSFLFRQPPLFCRLPADIITMGSDRKETGGPAPDPGMVRALSQRSSAMVHLTHNDLDAAGADAIHRLRYGDVFTIWSPVGKYIRNLAAVAAVEGHGNTLSISDIGYQSGAVPLLQAARKRGWRIEWRDHHRWNQQELDLVVNHVDHLTVDTGTCATGITAREFLPDDPHAAEIASVVCDYDLWLHHDPRSKVLGQVVMRKGYRETVRDCLIAGRFEDRGIISEYKRLTAEMDHDIRKSLKHAVIAGKRYRIAFAPLYGYPSETAHAIRDTLKTDIEVIVSSSGRFSIRSVPPVSHLIARKFGGGGHPPAAGGTFPFRLWDRFIFGVFKKSRHYQHLVLVAEELDLHETQ